MPIRYLEHLTPIPGRIKVLWGVNPRFHGLYPGIGQVAYALLTRAPVAIKVLLPHDAPRLACVKPVASVHPEPGSNSSLFKLFLNILAPESVYRSPKSYFYWRYRSGKFLFLILVLLVELCKSLKELFCRFRFANVAAKIRTFILNFQIIPELFF